MSISNRLAALVAIASLALAGGCGKKAKKALPAATDWQSPALGSAPSVPGPSAGPGMTAPSNPHAGVPGAPPLSDEQLQGSNPHAGVPGAPPLSDEQLQAGGNPHAGVPGAPPLDDQGGGAVPVDQLGLPAPERDRPIDASKFLAGTIAVPAANQARIPAGGAIFLSVRPADATGQAAGMPMAVDKLVAGTGWPMAFRITEAQAMVGGTAFAGPVLITARYDQDGEARSKQPGDISGTVTATIPAANLVITLDQVQP